MSSWGEHGLLVMGATVIIKQQTSASLRTFLRTGQQCHLG